MSYITTIKSPPGVGTVYRLTKMLKAEYSSMVVVRAEFDTSLMDSNIHHEYANSEVVLWDVNNEAQMKAAVEWINGKDNIYPDHIHYITYH